MRAKRIVSAPWRGVKRLTEMVFRRSGFRSFDLPRSRYRYVSEVGNGTGSSTVMAALLWIARTFPEAPLMVWRRDGMEEEAAPDHELLRLVARPNPFYSGRLLWMATLTDWVVDGNAYWLKVRNRAGSAVRELWWAPASTLTPVGSETEFVSHYIYRPGDGREVRLDPSEVVHFRYGLDADDPRRGLSPLKSVLREVFTDDEAANFTAQLLRNMGVPGLVVSPDSGDVRPSDDDVEATKAYVAHEFTGDRRGEPLVMSGPTRVQQFGFSPEQLNLKALRRIPEERVTAVLGVPAIVAGLGAGLDRSTFANYAEAREAAYESNIIPTQQVLAEEIRFQLLADMERDPWGFRVGFDLTDVRVLQEDRSKQAERLEILYRGGIVRRAEARRELGYETDEADEVFAQDGGLGGALLNFDRGLDGPEPVLNGNGAGAEA